mgnify:CR=1 FL=1
MSSAEAEAYCWPKADVDWATCSGRADGTVVADATAAAENKGIAIASQWLGGGQLAWSVWEGDEKPSALDFT